MPGSVFCILNNKKRHSKAFLRQQRQVTGGSKRDRETKKFEISEHIFDFLSLFPWSTATAISHPHTESNLQQTSIRSLFYSPQEGGVYGERSGRGYVAWISFNRLKSNPSFFSLFCVACSWISFPIHISLGTTECIYPRDGIFSPPKTPIYQNEPRQQAAAKPFPPTLRGREWRVYTQWSYQRFCAP